MERSLKFEEAALFAASLVAFSTLGYAWWWFPLLILTPDVGMLGYLAGPAWGARSYNLLHHRALAVAVGIAGWALASGLLLLAAIILFGHASLDRALGYGLKLPDDFRHTHLGWIGTPPTSPSSS